MRYWNEFSENKFFNIVFTTPIEIGVVDIFSVNINNDQSSMYVCFDIKELPDAPPLKWQKTEFNTCRIGLNCSDISDLVIKNMPALGKFHITIMNKEELFFVKAISQNSLIEFTTRFPTLSGPTVYLNKGVARKIFWL